MKSHHSPSLHWPSTNRVPSRQGRVDEEMNLYTCIESFSVQNTYTRTRWLRILLVCYVRGLRLGNVKNKTKIIYISLCNFSFYQINYTKLHTIFEFCAVIEECNLYTTSYLIQIIWRATHFNHRAFSICFINTTTDIFNFRLMVLVSNWLHLDIHMDGLSPLIADRKGDASTV